MDPSDEFDDIFLDSTEGGDSVKNFAQSKPEMKAADTTDSESSSSDDSSDSSDDSSVESQTNEGLYNSSRDGGLFNSSKAEDRSSRYFSKSEDYAMDGILEDEKEDKDTGLLDDDLDDVDDEALNEFFSQKSPNSQSPPTETEKQKKEDASFQFDEESSDEEVVILRKKVYSKPMDVFGDLDDDDLAELEIDEVMDEKSANDDSLAAAAETKQDSSSQDSEPLLTPKKMEEEDFMSNKDKTPFRITYNGEKKKCQEEIEIFDSSDDEDYTARGLVKSNKSKFSGEAGARPAKSDTSISHPLQTDESSNDDKENDTPKATPRVNPYQKTQTQTTSEFSSNRVTKVSAPLPSPIDNISAHKQIELQRLGISHDHFKPPKYIQRPDPILHKLDESNRPVNSRRKLAVSQLFSRPFSNMFTCKFKEFNHLQSEMSNVIANSDDNVIVSSPTGSGKTALFEMAMCRLFSSSHSGDNRVVSSSKKIVYIAPNKALCEERHADWSRRLMEIDPTIVCSTITGDANAAASSYGEIASANLILTTPEKWDSMTRRWTEYVVLLGSVKLVLLDEVHMIGDPNRGACWESVISRMKTIHRAATSRVYSCSDIESSSFNNTDPEALASNIRFVAVSATLPNLDQLAAFIEAGEAYAFNDSYRPVPLYTYVQACGYIANNNHYRFDQGLDNHVLSILHRFSKGRPAIVFCHTKSGTENLADKLSKEYSNPSSLNTSALNNFANRVSSSALQRFIRCGIGFHNAGLDYNDRKVVEEAFLSGSISCLCATSTLAMGVNLPSHLVVVRGTAAYRGKDNGYVDLDTGTLLQMIGRAGRPGFDTSGTAVIMTDSASKSRFENLSLGLKVVESHLLDDDKLTEALNCEIAQGVITSEQEATDWVMSTFLFRRIQAHPLFYGLNGNGQDAARSFAAEKSKNAVDQLRRIGAVSMNEDGTFSYSVASSIMSRNFLDWQTLSSITKLPHDAGQLQIIHFLSNCKSLQSEVKRNQKKELNAAYKDVIKYKYEGPQSKIRIQTPSQKVFVILQSAIAHHIFADIDLRKQMDTVVDNAMRILTAVEEYSREGSCNGHLIVQSHLLRRSIFHGTWGEKDGLLKQIGGVTHDVETKLKASGISSFADVANTNGEDIARACNMPSAFGDSLRAAATMILQCTLTLSACSKERDDGLDLVIKLRRKELEGIAMSDKTKDNVNYSLLVFTDRPGGLLLSCEDISEERDMVVKCPEKFGRAYIRLISNLVGLDEQKTVDGNDRIEKSSFSLSPTVVKSTVKAKRSEAASKPPETAKKRLFESERSSLSNVSDLRLHKRGKFDRAQKKTERIEINSDDEDARNFASTSREPPTQKAVTPSPHPATKFSEEQRASSTPTFGTRSTSDKINRSCTPSAGSSNPYSSKKMGTNRRNMQNRCKWNQDKRDHKSTQQRAFHSPKENPFSTFAYDPNDMEKNLSAAASGSQKPSRQSILPPRSQGSTFSANKSRHSTFRTPATRRKGTVSSKVSGASVLSQKAAEMNQYQDAHRQALSGAPRGYNRNYSGRFEEQDHIMQSDASYFNQPHQSYARDRTYGMGSRTEFTDTIEHVTHLNPPPHHSSRGYYNDPLSQSLAGPTPQPGRFHARGAHRFEANQCIPDGASAMYDGMSSAGHSNGSGLHRFQSRHLGGNMYTYRQNIHNYNAFQPVPNMQPHYVDNNFTMGSHQEHFDSYEHSISGLDPAERSMAACHFDFNESSGNGNAYGSIVQDQPRISMPVHNPYTQHSQRYSQPQREPPKEIVYHSEETSNMHQYDGMDNAHHNADGDASLAFDDAFL